MPPGTELSLNMKLNVLVFGRYKMGKTEGAATFPRPNFIECDPGGLDTVLSPGYRLRHPEFKLENLLYEYFQETRRDARGVNTAHEGYDNACRYFDVCMAGGKWKSPSTGRTYDVHPDMFDTWVLDSATSLIALSTNKAIQLLGDPTFAGKSLSNTFKAAKEKGLIVPKMQDFGAERSLTEQFISMLLTSGKHVVVLCHEREQSNDAGQVTEIVPLLTGQSVERVPLMFSNVMRLISRREGPNTRRFLESQKSGIAQVGSRLEIPDGTEWNWPAIQNSLKVAK
jgi:hypothetical protein